MHEALPPHDIIWKIRSQSDLKHHSLGMYLQKTPVPKEHDTLQFNLSLPYSGELNDGVVGIENKMALYKRGASIST